jgi:hypothetical protein
MKSNSALIGYTGFVGSNLKSYHNFDYLFNSSNIERIKGRKFTTVVCAAPSAEKWKINQDPEKDLKVISDLFTLTKTVRCEKFILISTIDVLTSTEPVSYGGNRLAFENMILDHFQEKATIIRLPGLFGPSLKKNIVYDLKNSVTDFVKLDSKFQWLHIKRLSELLDLELASGIIEIYPEPIHTEELVKSFFPAQLKNCSKSKGAQYDFIPEQGYFMTKAEVLQDLEEYLAI